MKALVVGCSFAKGYGLKETIHDPKLWANQFLKHIDPEIKITNLSSIGKNNHWIFTEAASELVKNEYDIAVVAWTNQSRLNLTVGLEKYSTDTMLSSDRDIHINPNLTITGKHLLNLGNQLRLLQNDHWGLLDLVKYVNILRGIQVESRKKTLLCVNSLLHFSKDYFVKKEFDAPGELSKYEQSILNAETRSDSEVKDLYQMIHAQYQQYGGIRSELWLNLYRSLDSMKIDAVFPGDSHPGYLSQDVYAEYLTNQFYENSDNRHSRRS